MKNKTKKTLTNTILSIAVLVIVFGLGYKIGQYRSPFTVGSGFANFGTMNFSLFWETYNDLKQKYVDNKKLNDQTLYYGAIKGMTAAIGDPYTFFMTPSENQQSKQDLEGKFDGIGAQLGLKDNRIVIVAPLKNSPAEKAGIKSGDLIDKVDGVSTASWTLSQAVNKIRGAKGTKVTLTIGRNGKDFDVTITRDEIVVPSVELSFKNNVAYLKLNQFGDTTNQEWDKAVTQIASKWKNKEIKGMILDLRDNPGGYLESAVYLASDLLPKGSLVVKQESANPGESQNYYVDRQGRLTDIPLVVLINQGSASASEILSGAIRDYKRGKLVGEKSFGKGSVQEALDLSNGAGLHVTVAKWVLPNGDWINGKGIEPDIKIANPTDNSNTVTEATDAQLQKAFDLLK